MKDDSVISGVMEADKTVAAHCRAQAQPWDPGEVTTQQKGLAGPERWPSEHVRGPSSDPELSFPGVGSGSVWLQHGPPSCLGRVNLALLSAVQ